MSDALAVRTEDLGYRFGRSWAVRRHEGQVEVLGRDPQADPVAVKERVGYVAESLELYEWMTVDELLGFLAVRLAAGLSGLLLGPGLGFEAPLPWGALLVRAARALTASGLILAIHTWMSLRWKSFVPVLALGILATVVTIALNTGDVEVWPWFPWSLPFRAAREAGGEPVLLAVGALGGLAAAFLGGCEMTRRDVL